MSHTLMTSRHSCPRSEERNVCLFWSGQRPEYWKGHLLSHYFSSKQAPLSERRMKTERRHPDTCGCVGPASPMPHPSFYHTFYKKPLAQQSNSILFSRDLPLLQKPCALSPINLLNFTLPLTHKHAHTTHTRTHSLTLLSEKPLTEDTDSVQSVCL